MNTSRKLDYIWISENLLDDLIQTEVENSLNLESDHKLVKMTIRKEICERLNRNNLREKRNNYTRTVFNTKNMNSEDWKNFVQAMDVRISFSQVKAELEHFKNQNSTDYQNTINRIWDEIENIILNSIRATILQIIINKTDRKYIKKQKSKTRILNNMIRKVLELIRQNKLYTYGLDKKVKLIKLFEEIERDNIGLFTGLVNLKENLLTNNYMWLTKNLMDWEKKLRPKIIIEEKIYKEKQIREAIEQRIVDLEENKGLFLKKTLEKDQKRIGIEKLLIDTENGKELIIDGKEVLRTIKEEDKELSKERENIIVVNKKK